MINPKDAWDALEPFALAWLEAYLGTTAGAQMDISHDAAAHSGELQDAHIPQAVLLSGLRALAGPLQSPAGQIVAVSGGQLIVHAASQVAEGFTASSGADFDMTVTTGHGARFTVNDAIRITDGTQDVWGIVDVIVGDLLTVEHRSGTDPAYFAAGAAVLNYGASGEGWVEIRADAGTAPRMSVYTHAGAPWVTSYEYVRVGNLNDYTAGRYGLVAIAGTIGGTRTQIDDTGISGYAGAVLQFFLDSATGLASCGAGAVTLGADGIDIYGHEVTIHDAADTHVCGTLGGADGGGYSIFPTIQLNALDANARSIELIAQMTGEDEAAVAVASNAGADGANVKLIVGGTEIVIVMADRVELGSAGGGVVTIDLNGNLVADADARIGGGLYVGDVGVDPDPDTIVCTQAIRSNTGFDVGGAGGLTQVVPLAKLTPGGADGSATFTGGILTGYAAPT